MNDLPVFLICLAYEGFVIGTAFLMSKVFKMDKEYGRKIIHIFSSFLIFPTILLFKSSFYRFFGPILFTIINFVFSFFKRHSLILSEEKRVLGIIFYPISIVILLTLYEFKVLGRVSTIVGTLIMGISDGVAGLIGKILGKHKYKVFGRVEKSVEGTAIFFSLTLIIFLLFIKRNFLAILGFSIILTLIENISPKGFDNLSVPLASCFLTEVVCHL